MVASAPVFVALLASIFFHERLRAWAWLGILISFVGVAIISIKPANGVQLSVYALIVLLAAIAISSYTIGQKPFLKRYSPLQFVTYSIWCGTFFLLFFAPELVRQMQTATLGATLAVVYMGIFPGVIGYAGWSYVLARLPATPRRQLSVLYPAGRHLDRLDLAGRAARSIGPGGWLLHCYWRGDRECVGTTQARCNSGSIIQTF